MQIVIDIPEELYVHCVNMGIKNDEHERKYIVTKVIKHALDYANPNHFDYEKSKIECLKLRTIFYTTSTGVEKSLEVDIISNFENKNIRIAS